MSRKSIPLLCYWDDKISSGSQGITFEDVNPKAIKVNRGVKHGELIDKICNLIGIDCTKYKLKIICRYLANGQYVALSIDDDESVNIMLDMTKEKGINCVELYIEKSYVFVRSQPDVHISVNDGGDMGARDPFYVYFTVRTQYGKFIPCRMKPDTPLEKLATAFSERENGMEHKFIFNGQQLDTQRCLNEVVKRSRTPIMKLSSHHKELIPAIKIKSEPSTTSVEASSCISSGSSGGGVVVSSSLKPKPAVNAASIRTRAEGILRVLSYGCASEVRIRQVIGDSPDTSKALRMLLRKERIRRSGIGGRRDPFIYKVA